MKRFLTALAITAALAAMPQLRAQPPGNGLDEPNGNSGVVIVPGSSMENPGDVGRKSHTNHLIFSRGQAKQTYLYGLTPAQIRAAYNLPEGGGAGIIAIVDAFHYANAYEDLTTFSTQMNLPVLPECGAEGPTSKQAPCFWQVYADLNGSYSPTVGVPPVNCGWNQEAALDIEWAHAMAPNASIVLVEAQSNYNSALFPAVQAATSIVGSLGIKMGQISLSWGGSESAGETSYDRYFPSQNGIVYFAASGDTGGKTIYPGVSPNVISAGGTSLKLTTAGFQAETAWSGSGGGRSAYESMPDYQSPIGDLLGGRRGAPDISFDADPSTGVRVYGPTCSGNNAAWMVFGGTSVSSPALAGIINSAASGAAGFAADTDAELHRLYGSLAAGTAYTSQNFRDIVSGRAGKNASTQGWDFVTGIGSSLGLAGK